jgi:hypothetical protein
VFEVASEEALLVAAVVSVAVEEAAIIHVVVALGVTGRDTLEEEAFVHNKRK